jgi:hypothetical protein
LRFCVVEFGHYIRKHLSRDHLKLHRELIANSDRRVWDTWLGLHSPISAKKLHALGYMTYMWNACEHQLFTLFCVVMDISEKDGWALAYDLGNIAIMTRIKVISSVRYKHQASILELIQNCLEVYEVCRQNRNQLTHFTVAGYLSDEPNLFRKSRNAETMEPLPFPDKLSDLRRVANDIRRLSYFIRICGRT